MVATTVEDLVRECDDGPDFRIDNLAKEREFRRGFLESARHIVAVWAHPPEPEKPKPQTGPVSVAELLANRRCDPDAEQEAAWKQRRRLRERYRVYGRGDAGRKTYCLGVRPGYAQAAARLRGRLHAMVYVTELWENLETADLDIFDPKLLCPWLRAVEHWASKPIRLGMATMPPPRVMDVAGPIETYEETDLAPESSTISPTQNAPVVSLPAAPPPPAPRLKLVRADQIEMRPPQWLLRGMLEKDTLALIFGDPGCGKSFLAIDWACRIATGTPWRGHGVKGGPVVYVAGEGRQGFSRRVQAWSQYHHVSLPGMPLYMSPPAALPEPTDLMELIAAIDVGVAAVGTPALIVIDTLARCFGGGDENSTQDMNKFVAACDVLRQRFNCTILVVHHAGHGDKSRARGAIALKAALDAEYRLENEGGMMLTATKMKDAEMPPPLAMKLVSVEIPDAHDEDGNAVTSAAIEVIDADTSAIVAQAKSAMSGKWQKTGLQIARRLAGQSDDGQVTMEAWREACTRAGMVRQNQHRVLESLTERGKIVLDGDLLSLPTP